ncbi:hypothetical protein [Dactylosporangium sp. CS-033363]|uniref:hypothetical protein n=1 Tax=Dactylosporangium sp. CS-033363 TaxID=3239935 RepID=UPI003D93A9E7
MLSLTSILAATGAGALAGAVLGLVAGLLPAPARALVAMVAAAGVLAAALLDLPMPQLNRETDQTLLHRGPYRWALNNAGQLGLGFTSRIGFWTWYLVPVGIVLLGDWRLGAAAWGLYGLTRLAMSVAAAFAATSEERLGRISVAMLSRRPLATRVARISAAVLAAALTLIAAV